jgi:hypothetical protein
LEEVIMGIKVELRTSDSEFNAKIRFALSKKMTKKLESRITTIARRSRILLRTAILNNETVQDLISGQLKVDFGLTEDLARSSVSQIINAIGDAVSVEFFPGGASGDRVGGGYKIGTIRVLINGNQASGIVLGKANVSYDSNGSKIDWLRWLMTAGSQVVIAGYEVASTVDYDGRSRSGGGFMIKTGGDFRVDPEHAGTAGDNFITRAISSIGPEIGKIIKEEIKRGF